MTAQSATDPTVDTTEGEIRLNFVNADIREVIDAVLGDALKLTYVVDPKVQGTVTVRTSQPLKPADVIPALEDILSMNGAALVKSNGTYKVVPLEQASAGFRLEPGFGIHIIPLRYASAAAIRSTIEPFIPPGRNLRVDAARNLLIFTGAGTEAKDLEELVGVFDVDWMAGMSFAIYPLQTASAKNVAQELTQVFGQGPDSPLAGMVQFAPIERLNAILVITPQPDYLNRAAIWIERLDRGEEGTDRRIYVYLVQNVRAKDLARVLGEVFGVSVSGGGPELGGRLAPGLAPAEITNYPRSGGASRTGTSAGMPTGMSTGASAGMSRATSSGMSSSPSRTSGVASAPTELAKLSPAAAAAPPLPAELAPLPPPSADGGISGGAEAGIRIVADERNNALVILAMPTQYRMIQATLKQLDIVPLQVLIEATIAEVTLNDQLKYGVEWAFSRGLFKTSLSSVVPSAITSIIPGFNFIYASPGDALLVLHALTSITDVHVISSPQLMVLDNESARLQVGDQVPVATQSAVAVVDPAAPIVNSIEYRDTGVILDLIPHVNASGLVTLDIMQEVSTVAKNTTSGIDSPTIQQRQIKSTIAVQSGQTVALGGLIRDSKSNSFSGIPILSEVPILGNLFRTKDNSVERTELLVLLTPRVIRNSDDAHAVMEELRSRLPSLRPLELSIKPHP